MKGTGAASPEHDGLPAGFIDYAIALQSARNADGFAFRAVGRDQPWVWAGTKSLRARHRVRRDQLDHAQTVLAIGHQGEFGGADAANLHSASVVERAAGIEHLFETRRFRIFDVDNGQTFRSVGHVGVGARDIEPARRAKSQGGARQRHGPIRVAHIEHLQTVIVRDERITELDGHAAWVAQEVSGQFSGEARMHWVTHIDDVKSARRSHVKAVTGGRDKGGATQSAVWIEDDVFLEEIIIGIAVHQRGYIDDDESFLAIGDVNESVKHIDGLLFILGQTLTRRVERERAGQGDRGGERSVHKSSLAERRHRRGHDALGESFLIDVGDVEDLEAAGAVGGVEIFAAQDDVLDVFAGMFVAFVQLGAGCDVLLVIGRIGNLLQVTADDGLRFIRLCPDDGVQSFATFSDVSVAAEKVDRAGAEA